MGTSPSRGRFTQLAVCRIHIGVVAAGSRCTDNIKTIRS